jgi:hypothetical protein
MTCIINASTTNNLQMSSDGSGIVKVQSNGVTTNALAWGSYAFVGSGSTPTLRSSYNISSITRNSAGNFTLAFSNSTTDANYALAGNANIGSGTSSAEVIMPYSKTTSNVSVVTNYANNTTGAGTSYDYGFDFVIFGN